jgi:hypothetical protein
LRAIFETRPLGDWLDLFDGEDVAAGPVVTHHEAASMYGAAVGAPPPRLGEHTETWRRDLGV